MGFEWHPNLHQFFEKVTGPFHDLLKPGHHGHGRRHALLWDCYLSGQMSSADLEREIALDSDFGDYVEARQFEMRGH